ncbi:hypothetical protein EMGBS8_17540, partial [Verrucomicrobiota bacterium]
MSNAELESLILCYLDGSASREQVVRLLMPCRPPPRFVGA